MEEMILKYLGEDDYNSIKLFEEKLNKLRIDINKSKINIAIVGSYSTGKSYFINSLLAEDVLPTGNTPVTSVPTSLIYGDKKTIKVIYNNDETKDLEYDEFIQIVHNGNIDSKDFKEIILTYKSQYLQNYNIIDTPGFGTANKEIDDNKTYDIIKNKADIIIWLFDVNNGTIKEDEKLYIEESRKKATNKEIISVINKSDLKTSGDLKNIAQEYYYELKKLNINTTLIYSAKKVLELSSFEGDYCQKFKQKIINKEADSIIVSFSRFMQKRARIDVEIDGKKSKLKLDENRWIEYKRNLDDMFIDIQYKKPLILESKISYQEYKLNHLLQEKQLKIKQIIDNRILYLENIEEEINHINNNTKNNLAKVFKELLDGIKKHFFKNVISDLLVISDDGLFKSKKIIFEPNKTKREEIIDKYINAYYNAITKKIKEVFELYDINIKQLFQKYNINYLPLDYYIFFKTIDNFTIFFLQNLSNFIIKELSSLRKSDLSNENALKNKISTISKNLSTKSKIENEYIRNIEDIAILFLQNIFDNSIQNILTEKEILLNDKKIIGDHLE